MYKDFENIKNDVNRLVNDYKDMYVLEHLKILCNCAIKELLNEETKHYVITDVVNGLSSEGPQYFKYIVLDDHYDEHMAKCIFTCYSNNNSDTQDLVFMTQVPDADYNTLHKIAALNSVAFRLHNLCYYSKGRSKDLESGIAMEVDNLMASIDLNPENSYVIFVEDDDINYESVLKGIS